MKYGNWDSVAGTATVLRAKDYPGFNSLHAQNIYTSPKVNTASSSVGTGNFSSHMVKQPACEINELPPPSATFKNEKNYTSPSPTCPHCIDKDNCTFPNKNTWTTTHFKLE